MTFLIETYVQIRLHTPKRDKLEINLFHAQIRVISPKAAGLLLRLMDSKFRSARQLLLHDRLTYDLISLPVPHKAREKQKETLLG